MRISELAAAHDALAERFKTYEQVVDELPPIEVLNELRYALRAALELLAAAPYHEATEKERELIARLDHALKCAYHDLVDGLVIELGRFVRGLTDLPSTYEVIGLQLAGIFADLQEAEEVIAQSRGDPVNRSELYEAELYGKWFDKLSEHLRYLTRTAKPLIDQRQQAREQRQRSARRWWWAGIVASALLGVLLTNLWGWLT